MAFDCAQIAEDQIVARTSRNHICSRSPWIGRQFAGRNLGNALDHHRTRCQIDPDAAVAKQQIVAAIAADHVIAGPACNQIGALAAQDRIVARAAIDHDAHHARRPGCHLRHVDHIAVARCGFRRIKEPAIAVLGADRITVAQACGIRVAVDHQRRAVSHVQSRDRISPGAAIDHSGRDKSCAVGGCRGVGDDECVIAFAHQDLDGLEAAIGDTALIDQTAFAIGIGAKRHGPGRHAKPGNKRALPSIKPG